MKLPDPENWFLTAFAALLAPWQNQLSSIHLISEYYQPNVQIAASLCGVLLGAAALAMFQRRSKQKTKTMLVRSAFAFASFLALCLTLTFTVDSIWQPGQLGTTLLRIFWPILYIVVHALLAVCVALSLLVFRKPT